MFASEIASAADDLERNRASPPIVHGQPRFSGALGWSRGIRDRLEIGFRGVQGFPQSVLQSAKGQEVAGSYARVLADMAAFELECMLQWEQGTVSAGLATLQRPLLKWAGDGRAAANFDESIPLLVDEVSGFLALGSLPRPIPAPALEMHQRAPGMQQHAAQLERLMGAWNDLQAGLLPQEKALAQKEAAAVERALRACAETSWLDDRIEARIGQCAEAMQALSRACAELKTAFGQIAAIFDRWAATPAVERKEGKVYALPELDEAVQRLLARQSGVIVSDCAVIGEILASCCAALGADASGEAWAGALALVANRAREALASGVLFSCRTLLGCLEPSEPANKQGPEEPFLEVALHCVAGRLEWRPSLACLPGSNINSLESVLKNWTSAFLRPGAVAAGAFPQAGSALGDLGSLPALQAAIAAVHQAVEAGVQRCHDWQPLWDAFESLWAGSPREIVQAFLKTIEGLSGRDRLAAFESRMLLVQSHAAQLQARRGKQKGESRPLFDGDAGIIQDAPPKVHLSSSPCDSSGNARARAFGFCEGRHTPHQKGAAHDGGQAPRQPHGAAARRHCRLCAFGLGIHRRDGTLPERGHRPVQAAPPAVCRGRFGAPLPLDAAAVAPEPGKPAAVQRTERQPALDAHTGLAPGPAPRALTADGSAGAGPGHPRRRAAGERGVRGHDRAAGVTAGAGRRGGPRARPRGAAGRHAGRPPGLQAGPGARRRGPGLHHPRRRNRLAGYS